MDPNSLTSCYHAREGHEAVSLHLGEVFLVPSWRQPIGAREGMFIGVNGTEDREDIIDVNAFSWLSLNQSDRCILQYRP
jgi:hypothetical protein